VTNPTTANEPEPTIADFADERFIRETFGIEGFKTDNERRLAHWAYRLYRENYRTGEQLRNFKHATRVIGQRVRGFLRDVPGTREAIEEQVQIDFERNLNTAIDVLNTPKPSAVARRPNLRLRLRPRRATPDLAVIVQDTPRGPDIKLVRR